MKPLVAIALLFVFLSPVVGVAGEEVEEGPGTLSCMIVAGGMPRAGRIEVRPVGEAYDLAQRPDAGDLTTAVADATGRARLDDLPPGQYEVRGIVEGHMPATVYARVLPGFETLLTVPVLAGEHRVTGRARWKDGRPFRGFVQLGGEQYFVTPLVEIHESATARADAEGRFVFEGMPAGTWSVDAHGVRTRFGLGDVTLPLAEPLDVVVDREAAILQGRVLDAANDEPVSATVRTVAFGVYHRTSTDADGRFQLHYAPGEPQLEVEADGLLDRIVQIPETPEDPFVVRLGRGGVVEGRVVEATGAPAGGARVFCARTQDDSGWHYQVLSTVADEQGRYTIDGVDPGKALVFVLGGGYATTRVNPFETPSPPALEADVREGESTARDLTVGRAGRLRVRVVDADGRPVRYAEVELSPPESYYDFWTQAYAGDLRFGETNADGWCAFPALLPDREHRVEVRAPGHPIERLRGIVVGRAETVEREVKLAALRAARVLVLDHATGAPVPGARVEGILVRQTSPNVTFRESASEGYPAHTDADGRARLASLPPGHIVVQVQKEGYVDAEAELTEDSLVVVRLEGARAIAGHLTGPDATHGTSVRIELRAEDSQGLVGGGLQDRRVCVGERFHFGGLDERAYVVRASLVLGGVRYAAERTLEPSGEASDLRLEEVSRTRLNITVVDPQGRSVPSATVVFHEVLPGWTWVGPGPQRSTGRVQDGTYTHLLARDGSTVFVLIGPPHDAVGRSPALGAASIGPLKPRGDVDLRIELPPAQRLRGRVLDGAGRPVAGVRLRVLHAHVLPRRMRVASELCGEAVSDVDGRFEVSGLGRLAYVVEVPPVEGYVPHDDLEVRVPGPPLEITLGLAVTHAIRVLDAGGKPAPGAWVSVEATWVEGNTRHIAGPYWRGRTSEEGRASIPIGDGVVVRALDIAPPSDREDLARLRLADWTPAGGDIRLPRGHVVEGILLDAAGRPCPNRHVGIRPWDGGTRHLVKTDRRGRFRFAQLEEKAHVVYVPEADQAVPFVGKVRRVVRPGTGEEIRLVVD